jgi:hypothetical protein
VLTPLVLITGAALPRAALGRTAALVGALANAALVALVSLAVFGPTSDTSYRETNWEHNEQIHGWYAAFVFVEAAVVTWFVGLAVRPSPSALRALYGGSGLSASARCCSSRSA